MAPRKLFDDEQEHNIRQERYREQQLRFEEEKQKLEEQQKVMKSLYSNFIILKNSSIPLYQLFSCDITYPK